MVIADITFNEPPKVPGVFYAVVSSESSFALAHLQYPVDGAKDSDIQTLHHPPPPCRRRTIHRWRTSLKVVGGVPPRADREVPVRARSPATRARTRTR